MWWNKGKQTKPVTPLKKDFSPLVDRGSDVDKSLAVVRYLQDGILVFNERNALILINPQAEELLQVRSKEVLENSIFELNSFSRIRPLVALLGGDIRECSRQELQVEENFILEVSSVPMIIEGAKVGTLIVLHDVTREKFVERAKTEFVTLAAHQLRTPLSGIKWALQTFLDGDMGKLTEPQKELIEKTYHANEKLIVLINNLLDVSRIEEGTYVSKMALSSIEEVIQPVIDDYQLKFEEKNIRFRFDKPKNSLPQVMLDQEKMRLVFQNFLDNAVKYTPSGGQVTVSLSVDEKEILVQVADTGMGIPKAQQYKVFNKFFRGSNVMRVETEGTGMGLFITKNIIEAHGGRVWFESEEGKGTHFSFTIPIKEKFGEFLSENLY